MKQLEEFDMRGRLAASLKCWHRLTGVEAEELVALFAAQDAQPAQAKAAIKTLEHLGYTYHGAEYWKPPLAKRPRFLDYEAQPAQHTQVAKEDIAAAWVAGYYHAGYTNDGAYANKMADEFADQWGAAPSTKEPT